ncbi:MAG TPA: DedA family protein [Baekduia sp.]|nr:DedA family protein [Baekduia sp.]
MPFFALLIAAANKGIEYLGIVALVAFDAVIPLAPGEVAVIAGGVDAAANDGSIFLVLAAAVAGAFAGDNINYHLGKYFGEPLARRFARGADAQRTLAFAKQQSVERPWIVAASRFVPGGRTVATLAAGIVGMPWRRFIAYELPGAFAWALMLSGLGFVAGSAFEDSFWKPLAVSLGLAFVISLVAEGYRRRLVARHQQQQ